MIVIEIFLQTPSHLVFDVCFYRERDRRVSIANYLPITNQTIMATFIIGRLERLSVLLLHV